MSTLTEAQEILVSVGKKMITSYQAATSEPDANSVAPPQLIAAVEQFLQVFQRLDAEHSEEGLIPYDDTSELVDHTLGCISDLNAWAERLGLNEAKRDLGKVALSAALWGIRHKGEIRTLEALVDACALEANTTDSIEKLTALFYIMQKLIVHASAPLRADLNKYDPTRPWRVLNFNFAIVATRTQNLTLMSQAFDLLGLNLPDDAPFFFEEGIKQAQKSVYGGEVKKLMQEYFNRWTVKH